MFAFRALLRLTCITLIVQLHVRSAVIPDQNENCNQDVVYVSSLADAPLHRTQSGCAAVADFTYVGQQSYLTLTSQGSSQKNVVNVWRTTRTGDHVVFLAYEEVEYSQEVDPWSRRISSILGHADGGPSAASDNVHKAQKTLQHHPHSLDRPVTLMLNDTFAVVRLASLKALSDLSDKLPRDTRLTRLVRANLDIESQNVLVSLPAPTFKPPLHALLFSKTLDVPFLQNDARILSGEDKVGQSIPLDQADDSVVDLDLQHWGSRHSATPEARLAAAWIRARLARDLAPLRASCIEWKYDEIFSPNVICTIPAQPAAEKDPAKDQGIVVISAHYDSRGTFGSVKAPGADDDGSGTTMLLALARHLGSHKVTFEREVRLVAFSGEEQGLVGSQHYAAHLRNQSIPVHFQLQTDMIGYRKPGETLQVAFPDKLATESATQYVMSIARMYVPELQLGYTPACCSDHQSFWEQGYTSTWIFERRGPIADPCYHDSCDRTDRPGYDFDQIRASTRLVLATLLDVAGGVRWPW